MTHIHLIGIGGAGLSAIARLLLERGDTVSGSDRVLSQLAISLREQGVTVFEGHRSENIAGADIVVRSSAVADDNPEVKAAQAAGIPVLKRVDFLGKVVAEKFTIAIAGTHGKTTTTAMMAWVLTRLGKDPSYIVGGMVKNLSNNAYAGKGNAFVIEADEYDHMFLGLAPDLAIVTTIEYDHPDCYPTWEDYFGAFSDFLARIKPGGALIASIEDAGASNLLHLAEERGLNFHSFAISTPAEYQAQTLRQEKGGFSFDAVKREPDGSSTILAHPTLIVPGEHNVLNALAVISAADQMGLPMEDVAGGLASFEGTGRRFDIRGEAQGVTVIDDYAHHPTEIRATLAAARSRYPGRRVWAIWQPHTFSRVRSLFRDFTQAFSGADRVIVTEIYAARENQGAFSSSEIVREMAPGFACFIPAMDEVVDYLWKHVSGEDVVLVLSAGDADQISAHLLERLHKEGLSSGKSTPPSKRTAPKRHQPDGC